MKRFRFSTPVKILIFYLFFMLLNYLYKFFPNGLTMIFSGIKESVYQHMKIAFYSYSFTAMIEYGVRKKEIQSFQRFFYSRLFTVVFLPLIIITVYLISPLLFGKIESIAGEVIWANVALLTSIIIAVLVEEQMEKSDFSKPLRWVLIFLVLISLAEFLTFNYRLPWFDILATPPGW